MPESRPPPPRKAGKAALLIAAVVGAIILTIFVGFNLYHAKTLREQQAGRIAPRDAPMSPTDLQKLPAPRQ